MAETHVSYSLENLANLFIEEACNLNGVRDELESIEGRLKLIQKLLRDVEGKKGDKRVRYWLVSVMGITSDVENVVEDFIYKLALLNISLQNSKNSMYPAFFMERMVRFKVDNAHHMFGKDTKRIEIAIRQIFEEAPTHGIKGNDGEKEATIKSLRWRRAFSTSETEQHVVGFEEDMVTLVERVSDPEAQRSVISIVGMGGSGKTTLAKKIYNNDVIKLQFDCRAWIHVSQMYTGRGLLAIMARQMLKPRREISKNMSREDLEVKLSDFLKEKRYLIVLDDVWENEVWDEVKEALPCGLIGNRILITTRNKDVASYFDPNSLPHELRPLNSRESWELLYKKVFGIENTVASLKLAESEKSWANIIARCDGLPLALVVIGGMLSGKSRTHQLQVLDSDGLHPYKHLKLCLQILTLSYHHLPTHLKWCFLYCGIFPDDYEIPARKLLRLWVAEGFIHPSDERSPEEIAEDYLEQLNRRSLIQVIRRKSDGTIQTCCLHRILREIAVSEARRVNFLDIYKYPYFVSGSSPAPKIFPEERERRIQTPKNVKITNQNGNFYFFGGAFMSLMVPKKISKKFANSRGSSGTQPQSIIRRLSIRSHIAEYIPLTQWTPHLRTVLHFGGSRDFIIENRELEIFAGGLKLIRVLDFEGVQLLKVPDVIGELIHLRYLGLKQTGLSGVPSTIGNLYNLQVLNIGSNSIKELPPTICDLHHLRVLDVSRNSIKDLPSTICQLSSLQTLDIRRNLITSMPSEICGMEELRHLYMDKDVVSGELHIDQMTNIQTISVVHAGNWIEEAFGKLKNLRKLGIYGGFHVDFNVDIWEFISELDRLGSLKLEVSKWIPVPTMPFQHLLGLQKLHLSGQLTRPLNVQEFPLNLTKLYLSWSYLEHDPIEELEKLPNLKTLLLQMQAYVGTQMFVSGNGFPKLEFLKLKCLNELQECKVEQGAMPVLTRLCISRCVQLKSLPKGLEYLTTLQELELLWMLPTFQARLRQDGGEDWYKIRDIPSVVISGTPITGSEN